MTPRQGTLTFAATINETGPREPLTEEQEQDKKDQEKLEREENDTNEVL